MNRNYSSRYANKEEKAFHEKLEAKFENIKIIANKEIVDHRKAVLEIDYIIFAGEKIFTVELKSTRASKIKGNQEDIRFIFKEKYEKVRSSPFHVISDKCRKIHSRLRGNVNPKISVLPIIVYGNPITNDEPELELDTDSSKISYKLSDFYDLLEEEQKKSITKTILEGYDYLNSTLANIRREIPSTIIIQDARKTPIEFEYNDERNKFLIKQCNNERLIPPIIVKSKDSGKHFDQNKLEETFRLLEDNFHDSLGTKVVILNEDMITLFETVITSTLEAFSKRRINYGSEFALSIYFHDTYTDDLLPYIERKNIHQKVADFIQSDTQFLVFSGNSGVGKTRILSELSKPMQEQGIFFFRLLKENSYYIQRLENQFQGKIILITENWGETEINEVLSSEIKNRIKIIFEKSDIGILSKLRKKVSHISVPNLSDDFERIPERDEKGIADLFNLEREEVEYLYKTSRGNMRLFSNLLSYEKIRSKVDVDKIALELKIVPDKVNLFFDDWFEELKQKKKISAIKKGIPEWIYSVETRVSKEGYTLSTEDLVENKTVQLLLEGSIGTGKSFLLKQLHYYKNQICSKSGISVDNKFPLFIQLKDLKFKENGETVFVQYNETIRKMSLKEDSENFFLKVLSQIIEEYLSQIFKHDKEGSYRFYINSILKLFNQGLIEVLLDGWDEIEGKEIENYIEFLRFLHKRNTKLMLTCRADSPFKNSIPEVDNFLILETLPLRQEQVKRMVEFRQKDYSEKEKVNLSKIKGMNHLLKTPLYLDVISFSSATDIPTTESEIHIRRIIEVISWEIFGRERAQQDSFNLILQSFENKQISINNSKVSIYELIFGKYTDSNGEDYSLFSILGRIAYYQVIEEPFDTSYDEIISSNPLTKYFLTKKYHPTGTAYPEIRDYHSIELFIAKKIFRDFEKGIFTDPLTTNILSLLYELLLVDPTWKKSILIKKIGKTPEDIIFEYSLRFTIQFLPSVVLDKDGEIISGIRNVISRSSMGVPQYFEFVKRMVIKRITDEEISEKERRKFKSAYIELVRNVPELTWDTIYDRYSGIDDPQFSVSIPVTKYIPLVQELYPQYLEEESLVKNEKIYQIYKNHCEECEKCKEGGSEFYSDYSFAFRLFPFCSKEEDEEERESKWKVKAREDLLYILSALENSFDGDLLLYSSFALKDFSLVIDDILFLLRYSKKEFLLKSLISKAYEQLSSWVDQELGCTMPPEETLCSEIAKTVFIDILNKEHDNKIYRDFFRFILMKQAEFNTVNWLVNTLKKLISTELYELLMRVLFDELINPYAYKHLNEELREEIKNDFICYQKEWMSLLPRYEEFYNLLLPWEKIKVPQKLLEEAIKERKKKSEREIEEKCTEEAVKSSNKRIKENLLYGKFLTDTISKRRKRIQENLKEDLFTLESIKIRSGLKFNLRELISNASDTEDVLFILNLINTGKVKEEETSSYIKETKNVSVYVKYNILRGEDVNLLCFVADHLLLGKIDVEKYPTVPYFVIESMQSGEKDYELMELMKKKLLEIKDERFYKNLGKTVISEDLNFSELSNLLGIDRTYYSSIGIYSLEDIKEKKKIVSRFMNINNASELHKRKEKAVEKLILLSLSPPEIISNLKEELIENVIEESKACSYYPVRNEYLVVLFIWHRFELLTEIVAKSRDKKVVRDILTLCDYIVFKTYDDSPDYSKLREIAEESRGKLRKLVGTCYESYILTSNDKQDREDSFWNELVRLADALEMLELEQYLKEGIHKLHEYYLGAFLKIIRKHKFYKFTQDIKEIKERNESGIEPLYEGYVHKKEEIALTLAYLGDKEESMKISKIIWKTNFFDISIEHLLDQMSQKQLKEIHLGYEWFLEDKKDAFFMNDPLSKQSIKIAQYLIEKGILEDYPYELIIAILISYYGSFTEKEELKIQEALENKNLLAEEIVIKGYNEKLESKIYTIVGRNEEGYY